MKIQGQLIRAKKAEKTFARFNLRAKFDISRVESFFGPGTIAVDLKLLITEDEAAEDNNKIKQLLFKNKKVFYFNIDAMPRTITVAPSYQNAIWISPPLGSNWTYQNATFTYYPPVRVSGYRIFLAAKNENVIIDRLSRAMKYEFMF